MNVLTQVINTATWPLPLDERTEGRPAELAGASDLAVVAWLSARRGNVIPLLGATSVAQLQENLASVEVSLDQLRLLDEASAPSLGFPHDLLRRSNVTEGTYGDQWNLVDDRRTRFRRAIHA